MDEKNISASRELIIIPTITPEDKRIPLGDPGLIPKRIPGFVKELAALAGAATTGGYYNGWLGVGGIAYLYMSIKSFQAATGIGTFGKMLGLAEDENLGSFLLRYGCGVLTLAGCFGGMVFLMFGNDASLPESVKQTAINIAACKILRGADAADASLPFSTKLHGDLKAKNWGICRFS